MKKEEKEDDVGCVHFLLNDLGLNPNIANDDEVTPLMIAAAKGRVNIVDALIGKEAKIKANVSAQNKNQNTALIMAMTQGTDAEKQATIICSLINAGADAHLTNKNGLSVALAACTRELGPKIIKKLEEKGVTLPTPDLSTNQETDQKITAILEKKIFNMRRIAPVLAISIVLIALIFYAWPKKPTNYAINMDNN